MNAGRGIVVLAVALVLSACSEGEKPAGSLPQLTQSPSATPTATPSVPPFPATKQGAADFAVRFYRAHDVAASSGDVAPMQALSEPDCISCKALIDYFRRTWARGSMRGGRATVSYEATALISPTSATVTFNLRTEAFDELDHAGTVIYHGEPQTFLMTMVLDRVEPGWRVARLTRER